MFCPPSETATAVAGRSLFSVTLAGSLPSYDPAPRALDRGVSGEGS